MRGVQAGGLSKESTDKVCKMHDRWLIRAIAAEAKLAAIDALLEEDDCRAYTTGVVRLDAIRAALGYWTPPTDEVTA